MITTDELIRLYVEILSGIGPEDSTVPQSEAVEEKRAILTKEIDEIRRAHPEPGWYFGIPSNP